MNYKELQNYLHSFKLDYNTECLLKNDPINYNLLKW